MENPMYLGDGLYAQCNGYSIELKAPRFEGDHYVELEPEIVSKFLKFASQFYDIDPITFEVNIKR